MKRRFIFRVLSALLFAGTLAVAAQPAWADRPYDFSDTKEPFINWPFNVTSVETAGSTADFSVVHIYHIDMSYDKVIKELSRAVDSRRPFDKYIVLGLTEMVDKSGFDGMVGYNHEHNTIQIYPEGAGTRIEVKARPDSLTSAVFDTAAYGFIMPDGGILPIGTFRHDGL